MDQAYLSPKEAGILLGFSSVYIRRRIREFPGAFLVGSHWRIPVRAIEEYIQARAAETNARLALMSRIRTKAATKRRS